MSALETISLSSGKMTIRHAVPGRLRIKVASIQHREDRSYGLQHWLSRQEHVSMVEVHPVTGSVILYYDPEKTGTDNLLRLVATGLAVSTSLPKGVRASGPGGSPFSRWPAAGGSRR